MNAAFEMPTVNGSKMQAIVQSEYGSADVLQVKAVDKPSCSDQGVLVKVHAASVNAGDWHLMRGTPFLIRLMFGGILKPAVTTLGVDIAGRVEAVGKAVTQFQPGDEVFGDLTECGFGAFAEYACAAESALAHKPTEATFEEAATLPTAAVTALQALQKVGQIEPGQKVLVNGASGGVGSFAVQIAKAFAAEVTAVCGAQKVDMVRSLGADHIVDYTQTDVIHTQQQYDLILDAAAYRPFWKYRSLLSPTGTYVLIGGSTVLLFQAMLLGPLFSKVSQQTVTALVMQPKQEDLITVGNLFATGKIKPAIDRSYPLSEVPAAIRHLESRQVKGKVAIRVQ